jgi:hypothetical protein
MGGSDVSAMLILYCHTKESVIVLKGGPGIPRSSSCYFLPYVTTCGSLLEAERENMYTQSPPLQ